jgi:hypothetical protein
LISSRGKYVIQEGEFTTAQNGGFAAGGGGGGLTAMETAKSELSGWIFSELLPLGTFTEVGRFAFTKGVTNFTDNAKFYYQQEGVSGSSSGGVTVGSVVSVVGTPNRITSSGGTTPVIDIAANYVGQSSIDTLGVITSGTWAATVVSAQYGGSGSAGFLTGLLKANGLDAYTVAVAGDIPNLNTIYVPYTGATTSLNMNDNSITTASLTSTGAIFSSGTITGNTLIKTGGTNLQFLMADGSVSTVNGTNFIQNQVSLQASSNFNISGIGVVGTRLNVGVQ